MEERGIEDQGQLSTLDLPPIKSNGGEGIEDQGQLSTLDLPREE
jgi:hypothetical protein